MKGIKLSIKYKKFCLRPWKKTDFQGCFKRHVCIKFSVPKYLYTTLCDGGILGDKYLKGLGHDMNIFLNAYKSKIALSVCWLMVFYLFLVSILY